MVISVANQKGGVAKTTTSINVAAGLALKGHKVLLIDAYPQANVTSVFIHPDQEIEIDKSPHPVLFDFSPIRLAIRGTGFDNFDFVPSHINLSSIDLALASALDNRSARLKKALDQVRDNYDYVIIDNPPSLGLLIVNSFVASDAILIPVSTAYFALTGLVQLQETIDMVRQKGLNPDLKIIGVLCTFTDITNVSRDVQEQLKKYFSDLLFKTTIPKNITLKVTLPYQQPC